LLRLAATFHRDALESAVLYMIVCWPLVHNSRFVAPASHSQTPKTEHWISAALEFVVAGRAACSELPQRSHVEIVY